MQRFIATVLAITSVFLFQISFVQAEDARSTTASSAAHQLGQLLAKMETLDADFQQRILDAKGSRLQEVSGHLSLARPGKFYWETENPFPQTVVSDGETLWLYDPDLEQVTVQQMDPSQNRTPAMLLSGNIDSIEERFTIKLTRESAQFKEFLLIPTGQESLFEELRLSFVSDELASLLLSDSLGQRTSIELFATKLNPELAEDRFTFAIPEGVDVIMQ
ncbi:outer membrane lipoprotein chaperone LolA [Oceanospirillum sp. HFRX-1_2]